MSTAGISSTNFLNYNQNVQSRMQQFQQDFQKLGQDLQSGSLSAAQQDFVTLQQLGPQGNSASSSPQTTNPLAQEFSQLSQDIQSGNLSAAQADYTKIQQDFQSQTGQTHVHHHHSGGGGGEVSQLLSQLGQELQSGNVSSAQQSYNSLLQDFQQFAQGGGISGQPNSNSVSVNA